VDHPQKRRALLLPLAATGYVAMADPATLLMQAPNWAERFLSSHRTRWWGYYYGMPAVATALVGAILGARRLQSAGLAGPRLGGYVAMCALIAGCADSGHSSKTTAADHQAAVLKDPFSYGGDTEKVDITGGGISEYDKKAMKRDVDSVLSP
jgi:hypothetical protein